MVLKLNDFKILTESEFETYFKHLSIFVDETYNIEVKIIKFSDNSINDFQGCYNGTQIFLSSKLNFESMLFFLAHLFGHCVQWSIYNQQRFSHVEQLLPSSKNNLTFSEIEKKLHIIKEYEMECAGFSLSLLREGLDANLSKWFSDYTEKDWEYLESLCLGYEKSNNLPRQSRTSTTKILKSKEIPYFVPKSIPMKYAY